jgi:hypothetical protein
MDLSNMSLAETQELMATMKELTALLSGVEAKTDDLIAKTPKIEETATTFRQAERIALRYLAIARRIGLPDQIGQATQVIAELLVMIRMLQMSLTMLELSTPYGWAMGLAGIGSVVLSLPSLGQ